MSETEKIKEQKVLIQHLEEEIAQLKEKLIKARHCAVCYLCREPGCLNCDLKENNNA